MTADTEVPAPVDRDRRAASDRRRRLLYALFIGGLAPRRRGHRREFGAHRHALDLHEARWLAVAIVIMLLSVADAFLTLRLMDLGAIELNPLMARVLDDGSPAFAFLKVTLTGLGVVLMSVLARIRAFGRVPVGLLLYGILALYAALIAYEFCLLESLQAASAV
jgi:uncharacterized protein DUF5658